MTRIYLGYNSAVEFLFTDLRGMLLVLLPKKDAGSKGSGREME
jgi:hypothetical protein